MKKIYLAAMAVAALTTLGSCSQDEVLNTNPEVGPKAIEFGVYAGKTPETRGLVTDAADATATTTTTIKEEGFGINAVYTADKDWGATGAISTPNFMYNQQVTYNSSDSWTYSPLKYWPKTTGEKISFFAWGPYGADGIDLRGNTAAANVLDFTVEANASDMVDFVATSAMNVNHNNNPNAHDDKVSFTLMHELTRINFTAVASEDLWSDNDDKYKTQIVIRSIKLAGFNSLPSKGTYTFDTGSDATYAGSWTLKSESTDPKLELDGIYNLNNTATTGLDIWNSAAVSFGNGSKPYTNNSNSGIVVKGKTSTNLFKANHYLFLLPIASPGLADDVIEVEFTYDIVTWDDKVDGYYVKTSNTHTVSLTSDTMLQGKAYNYQFKFDVHAVTVSATVDGWDTTPGNQDIDV